MRTYNEHTTKQTLDQTLEILRDAAKYDASCASSGSTKRDSRDGKELGSNQGSGICHAYALDGHCINVLKILMTNFCIYNCTYCIVTASSNAERARFSVDATMSDMVQIARKLRHQEGFRGYIHLKTVPVAEAGLLADRLSIDVELPTDAAVQQNTPEKKAAQIRKVMADVRLRKDAATDVLLTGKRAPRFASGGQSTQTIIGADGSNDATVLGQSTPLYSSYKLKRM